MRLLSSLAFALFVGSPFPVLASPINYTVNGSFASGGTLAGNISIDSTNGNLNGALTAIEFGQTFKFVDVGTFVQVNPSFSYTSFGDGRGDVFYFEIPGYITAFSGGSLCTTNAPCSGFYSEDQINAGPSAGTTDGLAIGSLASTPEPSSIVLLGTGMLAAFGAVRRRTGMV